MKDLEYFRRIQAMKSVAACQVFAWERRQSTRRGGCIWLIVFTKRLMHCMSLTKNRLR